MSVYDIAARFDLQYKSIPYPSRPVKPLRSEFSCNRDHGEALDKYELEKAKRAEKLGVYRTECAKTETEFKNSLGLELGIGSHPKYDRLYSIAYEHGHSSGFNEVAVHAEELAELLRD